MKKTTILAAFLITSALLPLSAFAAATGALSTGFAVSGGTVYAAVSGSAGTTSTVLAKNSSGVSFAWNTANTGYAFYTQHKAGTKVYGTSNDSSVIYAQTVTAGTALTGNPSAANSSTFATGWTSQ